MDKTKIIALVTGGLLLAIALFVVVFVFFPRMATERAQEARQKACEANRRVLLGSIEMYNMDNVEMIETYTDETQLNLKRYLRDGERLYCPSGGEYSHHGNSFTDGTAEVACSEHGTFLLR